MVTSVAMDSIQKTLRLKKNLSKPLSKLSGSLDRTENWLINRALEVMLVEHPELQKHLNLNPNPAKAGR